MYAGTDKLNYAVNNLVPIYGMTSPGITLQYLTENDKDYLCTRISYKLNLRGPSLTIQTACSTALYSLHLACESLLNGECDMALAGGASISIPVKQGYFYSEGGFFLLTATVALSTPRRKELSLAMAWESLPSNALKMLLPMAIAFTR